MEVTLGDETVVLRDRLDFLQATTITKAVAFIDNDDPETRPALVLATLSEFYVLMGVESWSLKDERGRPLPVTTKAIREHLLTRPDVGILVEAADELYQEQILLPLLTRASSSSPRSQTNGSTSPTPRGAKRPRKPSRPSSITPIRTDDTGETSSPPDGAYSSSQNLDLVG